MIKPAEEFQPVLFLLMEDGEDHDDDPDKVEFNGDKMILTSSDGLPAEFTRID